MIRALILLPLLMLIAIGAALLIIAALDAVDRPQRLPLVQADWPVCVTVPTPPLSPHRDPTHPYGRRSDSA